MISTRTTILLLGGTAAGDGAAIDVALMLALLAAFGATVFRYTHTGDFLVATPVVNRGASAEDTIGYFGNTVAMRMRMRAQCLAQHLRRQHPSRTPASVASSRERERLRPRQ